MMQRRAAERALKSTTPIQAPSLRKVLQQDERKGTLLRVENN
jgi:hypothetical protein